MAPARAGQTTRAGEDARTHCQSARARRGSRRCLVDARTHEYACVVMGRRMRWTRSAPVLLRRVRYVHRRSWTTGPMAARRRTKPGWPCTLLYAKEVTHLCGKCRVLYWKGRKSRPVTDLYSNRESVAACSETVGRFRSPHQTRSPHRWRVPTMHCARVARPLEPG
jgi:hypothetical protein